MEVVQYHFYRLFIKISPEWKERLVQVKQTGQQGWLEKAILAFICKGAGSIGYGLVMVQIKCQLQR